MGLQDIQKYSRDLTAFISKTPGHEELSNSITEKENLKSKKRIHFFIYLKIYLFTLPKLMIVLKWLIIDQ